MIKGLRSDKISKSVKHKTQIKSFPGSTVENLTDYVKPSLNRKPKSIILHVGTNYLERKSAKDTAKNIEKLCKFIKSDHPQMSISVSEIIHREDIQELMKKAVAVNKELFRYSERKMFYLIRNENVDKNRLNLYGLHLNRHGSTKLAKNIINHINCVKFTEQLAEKIPEEPLTVHTSQVGNKLDLKGLNIASLIKHIDQ